MAQRSSRCSLRNFPFAISLCTLASAALMSSCEGQTQQEVILQESTVLIQSEGVLREPGSAAIIQKWSGSGVLVSGDGYIVTNNHVAGGSTIRSVKLHGDTEARPANLMAISECSDLAVIKIDGQGLPFLNWHTGPITPGLPVMSASFPGVTGASNYTLTKGAVSTQPAPLSTGWASVQRALFHTAQTNTGNSGGPLVTQAGSELVGINYAGRSSGKENIAISAQEAKSIVEQLKQGKSLNSIGISGDVPIIEQNGVKRPAGVWVTAVRPGGKAHKLGIRPGDLITKIGGVDLLVAGEKKNHSLENYCGVLRSNDPNTQVIPIEILRVDAKVRCEGQINGTKLKTQATNGQATDCPIATGQGGGQQGGGNQGGSQIPQINEVEPNQNASQAQVLQAPTSVRGSAKDGDPALGHADGTHGNIGEDLYLFKLTVPASIGVILEGQTTPISTCMSSTPNPTSWPSKRIADRVVRVSSSTYNPEPTGSWSMHGRL